MLLFNRDDSNNKITTNQLKGTKAGFLSFANCLLAQSSLPSGPALPEQLRQALCKSPGSCFTWNPNQNMLHILQAICMAAFGSRCHLD
jgi:hypothetical protein